MKRRKLFAAAMLAAFASALSIETKAQDLVITTQNVTGDMFQLGTAWSNVLARSNSPIRLTPVEGGGTSALLRAVATERADIGFIGSPHYLDAVQRVGSFAQEPEEVVERYQKDIRALFAMPTGMAQMVVRADSGINTLSDLRGKAVAVGLPGGSAGQVWEVLLRIHGVDPAKQEVNLTFLEYTRALDQLGNNQLDATHVFGGLPQSGLYNASRSYELRYLSLNPASLEEFAKSVSNGEWYVYREVSPTQIKAAYGDGFDVGDEPVYNWSFPIMLVVRESMPDDVAYALVKALWDNVEEVKAGSTQLSELSLERALEKVSAPLHPGAVRYFRERGLTIPEQQ